MGKAEGHPLLFQERKVAGVVETSNGQVLSRRLKVLTDGHDIAADGSEVAHDVAGLVQGFSHPEDQPGLGAHAQLLRLAEELDRALIFPLGSEGREQASDGFDVVIENLRLLGADRREGSLIPFEIRNQDLNRAVRIELPGLSDCFGKDS